MFHVGRGNDWHTILICIDRIIVDDEFWSNVCEQSLPILMNLLAGSEQTKITVVRIISHWVNSQTLVLPYTKQECKSLHSEEVQFQT